MKIQHKNILDMNGWRALLLPFFLSFPGSPVQASDSETRATEDLFGMNIEQVLDIPVEISSKGSKQQSIRDAAGSVIVMDSRKILESGARNLWEILQYVPGFQLAGDVLGTTQVGFRGLTNVGRISLRLDGQEMSEFALQTIPNISHYPLSDVEKIEIIRGPGAVLYGGTAEYAVIEITTKRPKTLNEGELVLSSAVTSEGMSSSLASVRQTFGDAHDYLSMSATGQRGMKGSGSYEDLFGNSFRMKDNQEQTVSFLNVGARADDLSFRYIRDHSYDMERDQYIVASSESVEDRFNQDRIEVAYSPKLSSTLEGKFFINYLYDEPYKQNTETARRIELSDPNLFSGLWFDQHVKRYSVASEVTYNPYREFAFFGGVSAYHETAGGPLITGERVDEYSAVGKAAYGQIMYSPSFATVTVGSRYEYSNNFNPALVSRVAVTKSQPEWHSKLQVAQSFRSPGYINSTSAFPDPNGGEGRVQPEKSIVYEAELGHKVGSRMYLTGTGFHIRTDDAITLYNDPELGQGGYLNFSEVGSEGAEVQLKYLFDNLEMNLMYAYYRANNPNFTNGVIRPDGSLVRSDQFMGYTPHVVSLLGTWRMSDKFSFHSNLQYRGEKYENNAVDEAGGLLLAKSSSEFMCSLAMTANKVYWDNLTLQAGVNNLLNDKVRYAENGPNYHASLPGMEREFFVTARLNW